MNKITCDYGTEVSFKKIFIKENLPIIEMDFNIKGYKRCENGWIDEEFPPNIKINDKLYFTKEKIDIILDIFNDFLEKEYLDYSSINYTERGFAKLELTDYFNNEISIQQSSNFDLSLWFGLKTMTKNKHDIYIYKNNNFEKFEFKEGDIVISERMLLKTEKLNKIINLLKTMKLDLLNEEILDKVKIKEENSHNKIKI